MPCSGNTKEHIKNKTKTHTNLAARGSFEVQAQGRYWSDILRQNIKIELPRTEGCTRRFSNMYPPSGQQKAKLAKYFKIRVGIARLLAIEAVSVYLEGHQGAVELSGQLVAELVYTA